MTTASLHSSLDDLLPEFTGAAEWVVGLSGGCDSTVLLHLLHTWLAGRQHAPLLRAVHVDHGLSESAADWRAHCQRTCEALRVPLDCIEVTIGARASMEAAARDARYQAFESVLGPQAVLFLGHHLDDQVETFFQRLLRGAGVDGLAAMPLRRPLGDAQLVRPLLSHERRQLAEYAANHGLAYVEDPSNTDTDIDRNFIRHEVLPLIASRWPGYRKTVTRATRHLTSARDTLHHQIGVPETLYSVLDDPGVALGSLQGEAGSQRLRLWLQTQGCRAPDTSSLDEFVRQLREAGVARAPRLTARDYTLTRYADAVYRLPELAPAPVAPLLLAPGRCLAVDGVGSIELVPVAAAGLVLRTGEALQVRWRTGGEGARLVGRAASADLKGIFQEMRVPPWWRDRVPLLFDGDDLLSVADLAACQSERWRDVAAPGEQLWRLVWRRDLQGGLVPPQPA